MSVDIWPIIKEQALQLSDKEPLLESYYYEVILGQSSFEDALAHQLAIKLMSDSVSDITLKELFRWAIEKDQNIVKSAEKDLIACEERDPACVNYCMPLMYFKGYLAIQAYRIAHVLWASDRKSLARYLQSQASRVFDVDIHPAARIGHGLMLDHATGIVIGETSVVGNNVSMLHGVTLGGSGATGGQRHPKIGDGVMISCGAKIIGNIEVGDSVKIGGGSIVLESVPSNVTVVGVPAKIVGKLENAEQPALTMCQKLVEINI